jgi:hypothetical protein
MFMFMSMFELMSLLPLLQRTCIVCQAGAGGLLTTHSHVYYHLLAVVAILDILFIGQ